MDLVRTIFFGAALSAVHYGATFICLFEVIFSSWDKSEGIPGAGDTFRARVAGALLRVLSFPILLIGEWFYKGIPPDNVFYPLAVLNSCLWGFSVMLLWNYKVQLFAKLKLLKLERATI